MYKKILVPLDGSELAEKAIAPALQFLNHSTELVLASVVQLTYPAQFAYVGEFAAVPLPLSTFSENLNAKQEKHYQDYLADLASKLSEQGVRVSYEVLTGSPADAILDFVADAEVDLLVLTTHGRSGIARWYLGSVADKLVHASPVPVVLVRALEKEKDRK